MKILKVNRGEGKTFHLIRLSAVLDSPIVCASEQSKKHILFQAREMKLEIPEPIIVNRWNFETVMKGRRADLLIDDLELILKGLFENNILITTTSEPILEF